MSNFRERLTANAEDFDQIVSEILSENEELKKALKEIAWSNDSIWQRDRAIAALKETDCE